MVISTAISAINRKIYDIGKLIIGSLVVIIVSVEVISPNCITNIPFTLILLRTYDKVKHTIPATIFIIFICDIDITKHNKDSTTINIKYDIGISFIEKFTFHIGF